MIQKIKNYSLLLAFAILSIGAVMQPVMMLDAAACSSNIADNVAKGASDAGGTPGVSCDNAKVGAGSLSTLARNVVNIFSIVVGAVAIIMIIYGGFRYITSGGESGRVGNAKNTLIYAIIGLIIVALAQLIVHFVLNQADNAATGTNNAS